MKRVFLVVSIIFSVSTFFLFPQKLSALNIAGGHRGTVTSIIHHGDTVLSVGSDGFLVTWDTRTRTAVNRFQLTTYRIEAMVKNPARNEIVIIEAINFDYHRISVWNYAAKERLFSVHSANPVTYINYSAGGSFVIAAGLDGLPLTLLDATTGKVVSDLFIPAGTTALAITGRAERNMLIYQSEYEDYFGRTGFSGIILYFDIESQTITGSFEAPGNLSNPVVFGNNRFLAGINHDGLQIVDTTSGNILDSMENIGRNAVLSLDGERLNLLDQSGSSGVLYRLSVDRNGRLRTHQRTTLPLDNIGTVSAVAYNGGFVFSTSQGNLFSVDRQNRVVPFAYAFNRRITEIAAGKQTIAFLTEDGYFSVIPLNVTPLGSGTDFSLNFRDFNNYNRITPFSFAGRDFYILWQIRSTRFTVHLIETVNDFDNSGEIQVNLHARNLNFLLRRLPIQTMAVINYGDSGSLLVLDTGGNINVYNLETLFQANARPSFTFSSPGATDAAFIDNSNIIISRSVINNNSPFLSVNMRTGETVHHFVPVQAGLLIYPGSALFAAAIEHHDFTRTVFIDLSDASRADASRANGSLAGSRLFEYPGEASDLSITEINGHLAILCDSEGAKLVKPDLVRFERTSGLPVRLLSAGSFFITLDSEGSIAWHDTNGKIRSVFTLHDHENNWSLTLNRERDSF